MAETNLTPRVVDLLKGLTTHIVANNATDIHMHCTGPVFYRARGRLMRADGWGLFDANAHVTRGDFESLSEAMLGKKKIRIFSFSAAMAGTDTPSRIQCRMQRTRFNEEDVLLMRVQPESPPPLQDFVSPHIVSALSDPQGLVLVVGPIGGGKTTVASGIARYWASQGRHILTMEDPVEYQLSKDRIEKGIISHQTVSITPQSEGIPLADALYTALRSDVDGVFIGEVRTQETLRAALEFARCSEPVVSTYHAASIGDAIASLYQVSGLPWEVARMTLGSALQSVVYVALAYDAKAKPIPVILHIPMQDPLLRKALANGEQHRLPILIEEYCSGARQSEGLVSRRDASATAIAAGATQDSVHRALPRSLLPHQ